MTFRDDFALFWLGVLGVLTICGLLCNATRRTWDDYTRFGTLASLIYVGLYWLTQGLP